MSNERETYPSIGLDNFLAMARVDFKPTVRTQFDPETNMNVLIVLMDTCVFKFKSNGDKIQIGFYDECGFLSDFTT